MARKQNSHTARGRAYSRVAEKFERAGNSGAAAHYRKIAETEYERGRRDREFAKGFAKRQAERRR